MARASWYRLDNVGKFYSAQAGHSAQTVFRIAAEMTEDVDPEPLQRALDRALEVFPGFNVTLRSGLFWHYLEQAQGTPKVEPEHIPVCYPMHADTKSVLMRVSYYRQRINLEVSHMISDGRGTMELFKTLVAYYVEERYGVPSGLVEYTRDDESKTEDSFSKNYERKASASTKVPKAYRIKGWKDPSSPMYMEVHLSASAVYDKAKEMGVGVTPLLIAAIICAIRDGMPERDRDGNKAICLNVPVDLRRFFGSETLRNFFGLAIVSYVPGVANESVATVAAHVSKQLSDLTQPEVLKRRMNRMIKLEKNPALRIAPVFLKDLVLDVAARIADRDVTTTASNLGRVSMPEGVQPYLESVIVLTSTKGINFVMASYDDDLSVGISSIFVSNAIPRRFVETFSELGVDARIQLNHDRHEVDALLKQEPIQGVESPSAYPEVPLVRRSRIGRLVLAGASLLLLLAIIWLCIATQTPPLRTALACAALVINYLFVNNMMVHAPDVLRLLQRYYLVLLAMALIWFFATWDPSISTYVIPCICIVGTLFNAVMLCVFRSKFVKDYAKYLLFVVVLGLVPLALFFTGTVEWAALPIISAGFTLLLAVGLVAFARTSVTNEARKLFDA